MHLGKAIKRMRLALGLSVEAFGQTCGMTKRDVSQAEYTDTLGSKRRGRIAQGLGVPESMLIMLEMDCLFTQPSREVMDVVRCLDELERNEDRLVKKLEILRDVYRREQEPRVQPPTLHPELDRVA